MYLDVIPASPAISRPAGLPFPEAAPDANGTLRVRLDAMGLEIAIPAPGMDAPAAFSSRDAAAQDQVILDLKQALSVAERNESGFGGLYADALRLAIVTRVLGLRQSAGNAPELVAPEATSPRVRTMSSLPKWRLKRVVAYMDENLAESVTLAGMAAAAGLSRMHFAAQFRIATGLRPHEFLLRRRIECAQKLMCETRDSLVQIALDAGFQTQAHFTTVFRRFVGETPHRWRCANGLRAA
ncbi:hypothetical protein GCM10007301_08780 [Azorhizobium oxalatiphilum]|uniref:HTH araC/xylS-type domain-containing protein n=1 Tax=Azorhizobium oxalatiphilum TaxID=980631 RepID=A0A917BMF7_9HYPH|nr:AraC family transcriptional regulator [Azorhizobium oxalatiphilum]GGF51556.1 hypothetical protein GCM10007301_08780 [Azorhizobium oxalatiphilum]